MKNESKISLILEKTHDCEKCHGKIVAISVDKLGNTYCGYCGQRVDYSPVMKELEKENEKFFKRSDENE